AGAAVCFGPHRLAVWHGRCLAAGRGGLTMRQLRILPACVLLGSCLDSGQLPPNDGKLAIGTWGGDNAGVIVSEEQGHVHVGCTFGDMPPNIQLDDSGRFTVSGSYVLRAYPIQQGPSLPASFSGRVSGAVLTLAIA